MNAQVFAPSAPAAGSPPYPLASNQPHHPPQPQPSSLPTGHQQPQSRPFQPGQAIMPTSQIEMTISARGLINKDVLSKSDSYCVVLLRDAWNSKSWELGRTEVIKDCLSPEWVKKFIVDFNFEIMQYVRFEVWDADPYQREFLGCHETTLGEIVGNSTSRQFVRPLIGGDDYDKNRRCGEIVVVTEELSTCKHIVQMNFAAEKLPQSLFGLVKPDPFFVISRSNEDGTFSVVAKSNVLRSTKSPVWNPSINRVRTICNGDYDRNMRIDCFDWSSSGTHILLGQCYTTLRELIKSNDPNAIYPDLSQVSVARPLSIKPNKKLALQKTKLNQNNSNKERGNMILRELIITEELSFLDYIKSGTQMHFAVAIDFTASNGPPRDPTSLHYLEPLGAGRPNPYEIALRSVGDIIQQYDSVGMFPAFGFGAKLPPNGDVSHQFPLNGNASHPYCTNIDEIITHYRASLQTVSLYGPTNFSPVISNTAQIAGQYQDGKHYFVLLIITDGIISDMTSTKRAIIEASRFPLSIIIVGVGNADFTAMDILDSDDQRLTMDGRTAERDIVQFVPLNRFLTSARQYNLPGNSASHVHSQADLAREVLAEIPDQMTGYMRAHGFLPGGVKKS